MWESFHLSHLTVSNAPADYADVRKLIRTFACVNQWERVVIFGSASQLCGAVVTRMNVTDSNWLIGVCNLQKMEDGFLC